MTDSLDLVERLVAATATVIRAREAAITNGGDNLRSIHIEIELANNGDVLDTTSYLEWKKTIRRAPR